MSDLQDFKAFFRKRLSVITFIMLTTLLLYLPKLANFSYSIDSERMINNPAEVLKSWIGIGRFGLVFLKRFFLFGININPFFINATTYLLLGTSAILLFYILDKSTNLSVSFKIIAVLMYVCSPIHFEQTNFILQSTEVLIGYNLLFTSFVVLGLPGHQTNWYRLLIGVTLTTFSFSIYPSLIIAAATVCTIVFHVSHMQRSHNPESLVAWLKPFRQMIYMFVISLVSYFLLNKFVLFLTHIAKDPYTSNASIWGKVHSTDVITSIKTAFYEQFIVGTKPFIFSITTFLGFAAVLVLLLSIMKSKFINWPVFLSLFLEYLLALSPLILLGASIGPIRALTPTIPLVLMIYVFTIFYYLNFTSLRVVAAVLMSLLLFSQTKTTSDLEQTDILTFQSETILSNQIMHKINELNITQYHEYRLIVVGSKSFESPLTQHGEVVGHTHFDCDNGTRVGSNQRIHDFFQSKGYAFKEVHPNDYANAVQLTQDFNMKSFPSTDGLKIFDHTIVVKL